MPPHPLLVVALCVFLTPIAALLVGPTLRVAKLSAAVLLSQTVFHVLFAVLGASSTTGGAFGRHQHGLMLPVGTPPLTAVAPDTAMLVAHTLAALLTIALLWRGEHMLRGIARWVRAALGARMPQPLADFPLPRALSTTARRFVTAIRAGDLSLRGPPSFSRG